MKRIIRNKRLTAKQAAKYAKIRAQVAKDVPELVKQHLNKAK